MIQSLAQKLSWLDNLSGLEQTVHTNRSRVDCNEIQMKEMQQELEEAKKVTNKLEEVCQQLVKLEFKIYGTSQDRDDVYAKLQRTLAFVWDTIGSKLDNKVHTLDIALEAS
ncbi:hypothetical protein ACSQ67_016746 [Phaseolus vulgaris]